MLIQRPQGLEPAMAEVALVLESVEGCGAGDVFAVLLLVPGELLVGDGAVDVGAVDDFVDFLAVERWGVGTGVGFEVVRDS